MAISAAGTLIAMSAERRSTATRSGIEYFTMRPRKMRYMLLLKAVARRVWLYAACGVIAIPNAELQRWWESPDTTVKSRLLDVFDGAQPMSTPFRPNASRSPDGRLWFANENVVQMIDPAHLDSNPMPPPVHVEEIIADHESYAPRDGLRLPPLTRDLEVDYTALSFVAPQVRQQEADPRSVTPRFYTRSISSLPRPVRIDGCRKR
jgi:hypothetical protein